MKTALAIAALIFLVSVPLVACGVPDRAPAPTAPAAAPVEPGPSFETLSKGGFVDPAMPRITAEELKLRLDKGDDILLIDTRSDRLFAWYEEGHLPGAVNIHYAIDSPIPGAEEAMDRQLSELPDDTLKVLYCN